MDNDTRRTLLSNKFRTSEFENGNYFRGVHTYTVLLCWSTQNIQVAFVQGRVPIRSSVFIVAPAADAPL